MVKENAQLLKSFRLGRDADEWLLVAGHRLVNDSAEVAAIAGGLQFSIYSTGVKPQVRRFTNPGRSNEWKRILPVDYAAGVHMTQLLLVTVKWHLVDDTGLMSVFGCRQSLYNKSHQVTPRARLL